MLTKQEKDKIELQKSIAVLKAAVKNNATDFKGNSGYRFCDK